MTGFLAPFAPPRPASLVPNISPRRKRPVRASEVKSIWVERSATVVIEASPKETYDCYIDLEAMPSWSPWLKSVVVDKDDGDVSRWTLAARGLEFSWKARNTKVVRGEIIAWKSETGLDNRGKVLFKDLSSEDSRPKSSITLAIEFNVPGPIAKAINNNDFIGRFVEDTLLADLQRFRKVALLNVRMMRAKSLATQAEKEK